MYDINKMCLIFVLCRTLMENKKLVKLRPSVFCRKLLLANLDPAKFI